MHNCYAEGWVFGKNDMGGLVGRIGVRDGNSCVVNNCFSYVHLRVKRRNNGSLAFDVHADAQVDNCYWIALEEAKQPVWTGAELFGRLGKGVPCSTRPICFRYGLCHQNDRRVMSENITCRDRESVQVTRA